MWNERFATDDYVYGTEPNDFLRENFSAIKAGGNVLSLSEGEGRNGVFLAEKGYKVTGVDGSQVGLEKAQKLAQSRGVEIETVVADLNDYAIAEQGYDGIVSIFGHLPKSLREKVNAQIVKGLRSGGVLIMEGYSPRQLKYTSGGPKDFDMLYELSDLKRELEGLNFMIAHETERELNESAEHSGRCSVVQILARKL